MQKQRRSVRGENAGLRFLLCRIQLGPGRLQQQCIQKFDYGIAHDISNLL